MIIYFHIYLQGIFKCHFVKIDITIYPKLGTEIDGIGFIMFGFFLTKTVHVQDFC